MSDIPVPTIGEIFWRSWQVLVDNFVSIMVLTLVVYTPINVMMLGVPLAEDASLQEWSHHARIYQLFQLLIGTLSQAGLVYLTYEVFKGSNVSIEEIFGSALDHYGASLMVLIMYYVVVSVSLLFFLVPGVLLGVYGFFCIQVVVIERLSGKAALKYSHGVVYGRWWRFCGRMIGILALCALASGLLAIPISILPEGKIFSLISEIPTDLVTAFMTICWTNLYLMTVHPSTQIEVPAAPLLQSEPIP